MIRAILTITRPINVLLAAAATYIGGIISFEGYYTYDLLMAAISAGLIVGFGNVTNDIFDIKIDRRAKPFRPLPSGQLSICNAIFLSMMLVAAGIIISGFINNLCLLIASCAAIALLAYTPAFKGKAYWGNLLVAFISSLAFFYGAAAAGKVEGGIIPAVFAFLFHFIREIIKDMEDREADLAERVYTGAVRFGMRISRDIAVVAMIILVLATFVPYVARIYHLGYLIVVVFGCDLFLIIILVMLFKSTQKRTYRFIAALMKALMPLGLLAVFLGSRGF
jgi:geranylgeranylglycerol-phosphate geranylgeranyltransferase